MTDVVLFHHAHGLTDGMRRLADRLRAGGHTVHLPDLYDGHVFDDLESGLGHARETGFGEIAARGVRAAEGLPEALVVAGCSLGGMPAQQLAQTRPGVRGALLLASSVPASEFGGPWPAGVPLQVHAMEADPFFVGDGEEEADIDAARELVAAADDGELFLYPGDAHLFFDSSLPSYDERATDLLVERVLALLDRV